MRRSEGFSILLLAGLISLFGVVGLLIAAAKKRAPPAEPSVFSAHLPIARLANGSAEASGFAWNTDEPYPTLSGRPAAFLEFRLERESKDESGELRWERLFDWRSKEALYLVDPSGVSLIPTETTSVEVEDWTQVFWHQLKPAQRQFLLEGILEGFQAENFPTTESSETESPAPRFRIFERAVYIGSPLQVSGSFELREPIEKLNLPALNSFIARIKTPGRRYRNLDRVILAYHGSAVTVREAREESIALAQSVSKNPGTSSVSAEVTLAGTFSNTEARPLTITDLHEGGVEHPKPVSPRLITAASLACLIWGGFSLLAEVESGALRDGPVGTAYARFRSQFHLDDALPFPRSKHARRIQKRPLTASRSRPVTSDGVQPLSAQQIDAWKVEPGSQRWVVASGTFVAVLRSPSLKPDLLIPNRPGFIPDLFDNRRLLTLRDGGPVPSVDVWDLEKGRMTAKLFEKELASARFETGGERVFTVTPHSFKVWDLRTSKVVSEHELKTGAIENLLVGPERAVVISQNDQGGRILQVWEKASNSLREIDLGLTGGEKTFGLTRDGAWFSAASAHRLLVANTGDWKPRSLDIPGLAADSQLDLLGESAQGSLVVVLDHQKLFLVQTSTERNLTEMLPPVEAGARIVRLTHDGRFLVLQNREKGEISLYPLQAPNQTKKVCLRSCLTNVALESADVSADGHWVHAPVPRGISPENVFLDSNSGAGYSVEYASEKSLAAWNGPAPSSAFEDCLTYARGCHAAGLDAMKKKDFARAYSFLYGACRAGEFDACSEVTRSAIDFKLAPSQADSFADYGCKYGNPTACSLRAPAAGPTPLPTPSLAPQVTPLPAPSPSLAPQVIPNAPALLPGVPAPPK